MKRAIAPIVVGAVAAAVAAFVGYRAGVDGGAGDAEVRDLTLRLARIERRLDAVEARAAPPSAGGERTDADAARLPSSTPTLPRHAPPGPPSAEELAVRRLARRAQLESAFAAEPLDAAWAAATQARLREATLSEIAIQSGVAPESFDAHCRSSTCRIAVRFADGADSGGWVDHYILGAEGMLTTSETLVELLPDGTTEVTIFGTGD